MLGQTNLALFRRGAAAGAKGSLHSLPLLFLMTASRAPAGQGHVTKGGKENPVSLNVAVGQTMAFLIKELWK